MSVSGKLVLAIKMLLESQQYKAELNQAVSDTQAAAAKVEGTTKGIHEAVQSAVQGQSAVVRGAAGALVSMGAVAGTAVVAAAAVGLAYHEAGKETQAYQKAIILTGNAAGVTAGQLADMARGIDSVAGTQATAAAALATMTATGQVARENLQKVGLAAVEMERAGVQSISETAKIFADLGKEPVKASVRLNESMNYLTAGTYEQIKAAEELGDKETAASIAQNAAADALRDRAARVEQHLGTLERAWRGVRDLAKEAWDAMLNVGREQTTGEKLEKTRKEIADLENRIASRGSASGVGGFAGVKFQDAEAARELALDKARLHSPQVRAAELAGVANQESESANAERERAAAVKASIALSDEAGKRDSALEKTRKAVAQATQQYTTAIKNEGLTQQERAQIDANYLKVVSDLTKVKEKSAGASKAAVSDAEKLTKAGTALTASLLAQDSGLSGDFAKKWESLNAAYRAGETSVEELTAAQAKLLSQQPLMKQAADEEAKATKELAKEREKVLATQAKELEKAQAALVLQEEQNARLGLSKEAVAELDAAKLEMLATDLELQASNALFLNQDGALYEALMKQANAWREVARAKREGGAKQASIDAAKEAEKEAKKASDEWERAGERIEQSLTDSLMRGFESGKTAAENLRDTVNNMFKTLVLRPIISAVMSPVAAGLQSFFSGGAPGGASGGSAASTVMSAASMFGAGGLGGSMAAGAGWLTGATTLSGSLSAGMSLLGTGTMAGSMSGLGMIAGALAPIALGVGAVVSLIKKLDDSGTIHTGALSQYSAAGGLASSTTHGAFGMGFGGVDYSAETEKFTGAMAQSIVQMLDSTATTFGKEAGYKAATAFADDTSKDGAWGGLLISKLEETIVNWDPTRTSKWAPKEFADGAAGKEQYLAAVAADVRVALESIGLPAWATSMLDQLGQGASIEQLAGAVDQINAAKAAFAGFAQYMPIFADLADSTISKLVDASGGVQALAGNMATFVDQYYSDAEKLAVNTENVRAAMGKLGFEMPSTRDEFAALVKANMELGDAGTDAVAALLGVSGAFASVTAASETAAEAAARLADEQAKAAKEAQDAYQKQAQAAQEAADAARRAHESLLEALTKAAEQALEILGNAIDAEKKEQQAGYDAQMVIIDAQRKASTTFVEAQRAWLNVAIDSTKNYAKALESEAARIRGFFTGMVLQDDPDAPAGASVFSAQAALRAGDTSDAVLRKATDIDPEMFSSWADYAINFFDTKSIVDQYATQAERAASVAASDVALLEQQLTKAEEQYQADLDHYTRLEGIAKDTLEANILRLDGILQAAQDQLAEALGTKLAVMGLGAALGNFEGAVARLSDVTKNPVTTPLSTTAPVLTTYGTADRADAFVAQVTAYNPVISGTTSSSTSNQVVNVLREVVAELQALRTTGADTRAAVEKTTALLDQVTGGGNAMLTETA